MCIVIHIRNYGIGGLERVVREQCALFVRMGLEAHLAVSGTEAAVHYPYPEGVRVHRLPSGEPRTDESIRERRQALIALLTEVGADVYLDSTYYDLVEPGSIARADLEAVRTLPRCRTLVHWHTVFSRFLGLAEYGSFAETMESVARLCDGLIVLSRVDAAFFGSLGFRTFVLPNPVDPALVAAAHGPDHPPGRTILWCGRLGAEKRPFAALRVFSRVRERLPDARLLVVGGGTDAQERELRQFARTMVPEDTVEFTGEVADAYPLYSRADVMLNTSEREGYPLSFVEALAFGLPVVSVGKDYLELLRRSSGACLAAEGEDGVAEKLVGLLGEPDRLLAARRAAERQWTELRDFDLAVAYGKVFDALDETVAAPESGEADLLVRELLAATSRGVRTNERLWTMAFGGRLGLIAVKTLREIERIAGFDERVRLLQAVVRKLKGNVT